MKKSFFNSKLILGVTVGMTLSLSSLHVEALTEESSMIAGGFNHSLAYKYDGSPYVWGYNSYGQIGDGTKKAKYVREPVKGLSDIQNMAAGKFHTLAVRENGDVYAWGQNTSGKLGDGSTTTRILPVQVKNLTDVKSVSAGEIFSLALKNNGTVYSWGAGSYGVLGDGTTLAKKTPVQVQNLSDIVAISSGNRHSLALSEEGDVYAWGYNGMGQIGNGTKTNALVPVKVEGLSDIVAISAGNNFSLAVKRDGTVYAWGQNSYGKLGDGTTATKLTPVQVKGLTGVVDVAAGFNHSLALKSDGTVFAWGQNNYYQLGDDTKINKLVPVKVKNLTDVYSISAGAYHSMAIKESGDVFAWGQNSYGKIGDGTTVVKKVPALVKGLNIIKPNPEIDESEIEPVNESEVPEEEPTEEEEVAVDITAPVTLSNVPGEWIKPGFQVVLTSEDEESDVENTYYSFNGSAFVNGNVFTVNESGIHTITFYSVDSNGNEETPKTVELKIDGIAPVTSSNVEDGLYNQVLNVELTSFDDESSVDKTYYSINGSAEFEGNRFTLIEEGVYTIQFYSVDKVGNKEEVKTLNVTLDKSAPVTTSNIEDVWYKEDVFVEFFSSDLLSMVERTFYLINGFAPIEGSSFVISEEGIHYVSFYSVDKAGNAEEPNHAVVKIDKTSPVVSLDLNQEYALGSKLNIQYEAKDELSGIASEILTVNGQELANGNEILLNKTGIQHIKLVVTDNAGWTTVLEKDIVVYLPVEVKVEPKIIVANDGKFTVKVEVPKGFTDDFVLSSVTLNGVKPISEKHGDSKKAEKGMFKFERNDFNWESGNVTLEFRGTLSTGEAVVGHTTVEVKNPSNSKGPLDKLVSVLKELASKVK